MAEIEVTITTVDDRIIDTEGRNANGWLTVRPNKSSEYTNGATYTIALSRTRVRIVDGQLQDTLVLYPTYGAGNVPDTHYIAVFDVNGERFTQYWRLDGSGLASYNLEFGDIEHVIASNSVSEAIENLQGEPDPFTQYFKRSESSSIYTIELADDDLGKLVRVDSATGKIDPSLFDSFPSGTRLLFQQIAPPTGWTRDTAAAFVDAIMVTAAAAAVSVGSGGSGNARTFAHVHTSPAHGHPGSTYPNHNHGLNAHTHGLSSHTHDVNGSGVTVTQFAYPATGTDTYFYHTYSGSGSTAGPSNNTSGAASGDTATDGGGSVTIATAAATINSTSISPKYFEVIVAEKD